MLIESTPFQLLYFLSNFSDFMDELTQANTEMENSSSSTGDLELKVKELKAQMEKLNLSNTAMEKKRAELLDEVKKRKRIDTLLSTIGLDIEDENVEADLFKKLSGSSNKEAVPVSSSEDTDEVKGSATVDPQSLEMKSQLKLLQKKLNQMEKKAEEAERREREAIEKRKRDYIELKVKESLQKLGCIQPSHFFRLTGNSFRLSDDGETIIGGPEHDPRSLEDSIEVLKDDREFAMYFSGNGATGSGMGNKAMSGFGGQSMKNPFRSDQRNVTEASKILSTDPEKAKRLALEARSAGKLDSTLAKAVGL